jgi:hypothetical protein
MPSRPVHPSSVRKTLTFVFTIVMGIAAGYLWTAVEAVEDKVRSGKRHVVEHSDKRK